MNATPFKHLIQQQTDAFMQRWFAEGQQTHRHVDHSHSTNSQLIEEICQNKLDANKVHLLTAGRQSAGRGQHGRHWQSPTGNLYLSLYCPTPLYTQALNSQVPQHNWTNDSTSSSLSLLPQPPKSPQLSGMLSLCVGYALTSLPFVQNLNERLLANHHPKIGVKWANDLGFYLPVPDSHSSSIPIQKSKLPIPFYKFYKLAGTLIEPVWLEGKLLGVVVGVGMNINVAPTISTTPAIASHYHHSDINAQDVNNRNHSVCLAQLLKKVVTSPITPVNVSDLYLPVCQAIFQGLLTQQVLGLSHPDIIPMDADAIDAVTSMYPTSQSTAIQKPSGGEPLPQFHQQFMHDFAQVNLLHQRFVVCALPDATNPPMHTNNKNQRTVSSNDVTSLNESIQTSVSNSSIANNPTANNTVGKVIGIDVNGCLLVQQESGKVSQIFTGQITLLSD